MAWVNRVFVQAITQICQIYLPLVSQIVLDGGRLKSFDGHMSYGKVKGNELERMSFNSQKIPAEKWNTEKGCVSRALPHSTRLSFAGLSSWWAPPGATAR